MSTQLSLSETANILHVSEKSIRRYIKSGRIKATLIKGQKGYEYRIDRDQLKIFDKPPRGKNSHKVISKRKPQKTPDYKKVFTTKQQSDIYNSVEENISRDEMSKVSDITPKNKERILYMADREGEVVDYRLLYEKLLAKYEQALVMIGSLEAQLKNGNQAQSIKGYYNPANVQIQESISRQEDLILELYQMLRMYQDNRY